jgi:hypothetical protein
MQDTFNEIINLIGRYVPNLLGALAILVIGWLIALLISTVLRKVLQGVELNKRLASWTGEKKKGEGIDLEQGISKGVFYLLMLFILVPFFQTLGITLITEPLNSLLNSLFAFAPKLIGAGVLLLVAWVVASVLRMILERALSAAKVDERLGSSAGGEEKKPVNLTKPLSDAVYWLVFLLFLPGVLGALEMKGLLEPVQGMFNKILEFLPNVLTAGIIFLIGFFVARIVRHVVANLLAAVGTDSLSEKAGLSSVMGEQKLSQIVGLIVFALIIIPVAIAALNTLALEAITNPASAMLNMILTAIPNIIASIAVIALSYFIGRFACTLITNLLTGVGFNSILVKLGLQKQEPAEGERTPSEMVGSLVLIAIMFFSSLEASRLLGFASLANLVNQFMVFASHIFVGLVIFAIGLYLSNLASRTIKESETSQANILAGTARAVILVLSGSIALRHMGLANEIISLAFGLILGAIAIAAAISFGIGGRDMASRKLEEWSGSPESKQS